MYYYTIYIFSSRYESYTNQIRGIEQKESTINIKHNKHKVCALQNVYACLSILSVFAMNILMNRDQHLYKIVFLVFNINCILIVAML